MCHAKAKRTGCKHSFHSELLANSSVLCLNSEMSATVLQLLNLDPIGRRATVIKAPMIRMQR